MSSNKEPSTSSLPERAGVHHAERKANEHGRDGGLDSPRICAFFVDGRPRRSRKFGWRLFGQKRRSIGTVDVQPVLVPSRKRPVVFPGARVFWPSLSLTLQSGEDLRV